MTIAFDATALYGRFGGVETLLWQMFSALRALDTENHYLVWVPADAPAPPAPPNERWQWRRLPFEGAHKLRRIAWQQLELPRLLLRERVDVLHSWNYVAPLWSPVPVVLNATDLIALNRPRFATRFNRWHYRALMPRNLRHAARVVVPSESVRAQVLCRAPHAQVRVVPLGVEAQFFEPVTVAQKTALRAKYNLPPRFVLFVGNFEPKKNLSGLMSTLARLPHAPPLVVAGGIKPWPGVERRLAQVKKLDFVPRDELPALYSLCEVFCFPSLAEGFGLPVLEALACGAPVVASTQVPIPDLKTVALCPNPRFPGAIARDLDALLRNSVLRRERGEQGREYARHFTWERAAREILAIYRELERELETR